MPQLDAIDKLRLFNHNLEEMIELREALVIKNGMFIIKLEE